MTEEEYLLMGHDLKNAGHYSDGCTLFNWYTDRFARKAKQACWSHDFGSRGLVAGVKSGKKNDVMFKKTLIFLGYPVVGRLMYVAVRLKTATGLKPYELATYVVMIVALGLAIGLTSCQ